MGVVIQEITARQVTPTLTPAIREFLDGLAEMIARDILKQHTGDARGQGEPDRTIMKEAS
ncbi:MAG TPA: hypothetical protein VHM88_16390 [Candidatus Acidoferrales bacterium]|nr:hypothetical protein [Candidatus Acidoferrales bacterium]